MSAFPYVAIDPKDSVEDDDLYVDAGDFGNDMEDDFMDDLDGEDSFEEVFGNDDDTDEPFDDHEADDGYLMDMDDGEELGNDDDKYHDDDFDFTEGD